MAKVKKKRFIKKRLLILQKKIIIALGDGLEKDFMEKKVIRKRLRFLLILLTFPCLVFFFNCHSTNLETDVATEIPPGVVLDEDDNFFKIYFSSEFQESLENEKYVFIRLYKPYYDNPFCPENILNGCIKVVDVSDEFTSHSAIGFTLNDNFYGLTSTDKNKNLTIESCTNPNNNKYMEKCNIKKSVQITYALKVTDEEYYNLREMVEEYYYNPNTKYDIGQNFKIALHGLNRKFLLSEDKKVFAGSPDISFEETFAEEQTDFVCSTFIAHVLANSVQSVHDYFIENQIDSNLVMPSDLAYIPGMIKLFKSTWIDYDIAARTISKTYTAFVPYFSETISYVEK